MTREESKSCIQTIELLRRLAFNVHGVMDVIDAQNCDKIIAMLSQEPCKDCISRRAVDTLVDELARAISDERCCISRGRSTGEIMQDILDLPSVNSQRMGHWIKWYETIDTDICTNYIPHCKCSECGKEYDPHSSQFIKYCNECGAKMEEQESEGKDGNI